MTDESLPAIQATGDERGIAIDRVGVSDLEYPIQVMDSEGNPIPVSAKISMSVDFFNAGVSSADRKAKAERFRNNQQRVLITTTSLKMGVNFPVTDVILRDQVLHGRNGSARLSYGDVLQMMGRAGRGDLPGRSVILCMKEEERRRLIFRTCSPQTISKTLNRK